MRWRTECASARSSGRRRPAEDLTASRTGVPARCTHPRIEGLHVGKYEIIDQIRRINTSASPDFLASFPDEDLLAYFHQLQELQHELAQRQQDPEPIRHQERDVGQDSKGEPMLVGEG